MNLGYAAAFSWSWIGIKISQAVRSKNVACEWAAAGAALSQSRQ